MVTPVSRRAFTTLAAALPFAPAFAQAPLIRQSGIQEVVISVFDFDHLAIPFADTGDFERVALPDAPREQWASWRVPPACTRIEQMLLRAKGSAAGQGSMKLVKFHGVDQKVMRSSQRSWDTGCIFDVDVRSRGTAAAYKRLQQLGWTALGEPVEYTEATFHVIQSVAVGPNGFMLAIIQSLGTAPSDSPPFKVMSPIFNSTQMVADLDKALAFYTGVLGFKTRVRFDINHQAEPGADVLGLPLPQAETADRKLAMLRTDEAVSADSAATAAVELIENASMKGRDFSNDCTAPNVGILSLRIPVKDARTYAGEIEARGAVLFSKPIELDVAPYGRVTLFGIQSPEGALMEFYSRG
jgi:predicted enzyme related to lactoylglutathione lyase